MSMRVLQLWQQVLVPHSSSRQRCHVSNGCGGGGGGPLVCRFPRKWDRPSLLPRSRSCESTLSTSKFMSRTSVVRLFSFSDEEFPENIDDDCDDNDSNTTESCSDEESSDEKDGDGGCDHNDSNTTESFSDNESSDEKDCDGGAQLSEQEERMRDLREEMMSLWRSIAEEAWIAEERAERETKKRLVSPVRVEIEPGDDIEEFLHTEVAYLSALSTDPHNPLLLANFAQFLYLIFRDCGRAEEYFERAVTLKEEDAIRDAEAYRKYGEFLWRVKKDLLAADKAFFEAFCIEPNNTFYADVYAHFLWITSLYN